MQRCCRPGEGCNARGAAKACALTELRRADSPQARRALELWDEYQRSEGARGRRFQRRAYERARDDALPPWAPWPARAA
jgi:hypothetical protein